MKKGIIHILAAAASVCLGVALFSACGKDNHEHTYSDQWSYSQTDHWHGATCEHTDQKKDVAAHTDSNNDGKCDVCNYAMQSDTVLATPVLTLTGNVISWETVEHAEKYEVYEGETLVSTQTNTSYTIQKDNAGSYAFTVKAISSAAEYSDSALSAPVTYRVYNLSVPELTLSVNVLSWEPIDHADRYLVYEGDSLVSEQTENTYTIQKSVAGNYNFTVIATSTAPNYLNSSSAPVTYIVTALAAPVATINGNTLNWNTVDNADSYKVYKDGELIAETEETHLILTGDVAGNYVFTVVATSQNPTVADSAPSAPATLVIAQLETPVIAFEGLYEQFVRWLDIEYADDYEVYENGVLLEGDDLLAGLPWENKVEHPITRSYKNGDFGDFTYQIRALSDDLAYAPSELSNSITFTVFENPKPLGTPVLTLTGNILSWTAVDKASGYQVFMNGRLWISPGVKTTSYSVKDDATYTVKAIAHSGDPRNYADGELSNEVTYIAAKTLVSPTLTIEGNVLSWNKISNADGYNLYENGTLLTSLTENTYTVVKTEPGEYKYTVTATSSDENYLMSSPSNEEIYYLYRVETPVLRFAGAYLNFVQWDKVPNANNYEVYMDGTLISSNLSNSYDPDYNYLSQKFDYENFEPGLYSFTVIAKGDNINYLDSFESEPIVYEKEDGPLKLAAPVIWLDGHVIRWEAVPHCSVYSIYCNDGLVGRNTILYYDLSLYGYREGTYKVLSFKGETGYEESDYSNEIVYTKASAASIISSCLQINLTNEGKDIIIEKSDEK